jgi:hypothetical protein
VKLLRMFLLLLFLAPTVLFAHGADGGSFKAKNFWLGWMTLSKAKSEKVPVDWVLKVAPETNRIRPKQMPLPAWQVKELETKIGPLHEEERQIIAYELKKDGPLRPKKKFGYVIFFHAQGQVGALELALRLDAQGKLLDVSALSYPEGEAPLDPQFWAQFSQKTLQDTWELGQDLKAPEGKEALAQIVSASSKRALLLALSALRLIES